MSYDRPQTLEDALAHLAGGTRAVVAAGCTDLFAATEAKTLPGPVLDVTAISELRGVSRDVSGGMRIGATTTWSDLATADLPPALHSLQQAALQVGARQVQNRATLAGNLCNASPAADGVPPLLAVDASVELTSARGPRTLPLSAFLLGPRQTARAKDELLTAILVPPHALTGTSAFEKLGARAYLVISIAMVAVRVQVTEGFVSDLAIAIGACGPVASRLSDVEARLIGAPVEALADVSDAEIAAGLSPITDIRADAAYRSQSVGTLVRRAAAQALRAEDALQ